jgi:hypothetical protein
MATCRHCKKCWQSYGGDDPFCSDKCEKEFKDIVYSATYNFVQSLDRKQVSALMHIVMDCGDPNILDEVLGLCLEDRLLSGV